MKISQKVPEKKHPLLKTTDGYHIHKTLHVTIFAFWLICDNNKIACLAMDIHNYNESEST